MAPYDEQTEESIELSVRKPHTRWRRHDNSFLPIKDKLMHSVEVSTRLSEELSLMFSAGHQLGHCLLLFSRGGELWGSTDYGLTRK